MKKQRVLVWLACILVLSTLWAVSLAEDALTGEWKGSADVSGVPFSLSVTAKFNDDGTFSISTFGFNAKGQYTTDGQNLAIVLSETGGIFSGMLQSPKDIGQVQVPITLKDDTLSISANTQGMSGSMSLKKK